MKKEDRGQDGKRNRRGWEWKEKARRERGRREEMGQDRVGVLYISFEIKNR